MPPETIQPTNRRAAPVNLLWGGSLLLLVGVLGSFDMVNADIWWHLRTGQLIMSGEGIPSSDWYTYMNPEARWIDLHWLFQVVSWGIFSQAGTAGLIFAKVAIGAATFWLLLSCRKTEWSVAVGVGCLLIPAFLFAGRYLVRPEIVSLFLLAATIRIVHLGQQEKRFLWLLPLVQLVWVNCQSLFILQWVVLACFTLEFLAQWRFADAADNDQAAFLRTWWQVLGVTAVCTFMNPYGWYGATFPLVVFEKIQGENREFFHAFAGELRGPVDFIRQYGLMRVLREPTVILMSTLFISALVPTIQRWRRGDIEIARPLLLFGFTYLAFRMSRNAALFAVVGGYVARWNIGAVYEQVGQSGWFHGRHVGRTLQICLMSTLAVSIAWCGSGRFHASVNSAPPRAMGWGESDWYPHDAARVLADARMPSRIVAHHLGVAAVVIFHACPDKKIFVDARLETNTRSTLSAYQQLFDGLTKGDQRVLQSLTRDLPEPEWPAIVVSNHHLVHQPLIFQALQTDPRWVCVHSSRPRGFVADRGRVIPGASIFIARERQLEKGIPLADVRWLIAAIRTPF